MLIALCGHPKTKSAHRVRVKTFINQISALIATAWGFSSTGYVLKYDAIQCNEASHDDRRRAIDALGNDSQACR